MHETHIDNLLAFRTNLKHSIRDIQHAAIGGGEFSPVEQTSLLTAVEYCLLQNKKHGSEHVRTKLTQAGI